MFLASVMSGSGTVVYININRDLHVLNFEKINLPKLIHKSFFSSTRVPLLHYMFFSGGNSLKYN